MWYLNQLSSICRLIWDAMDATFWLQQQQIVEKMWLHDYLSLMLLSRRIVMLILWSLHDPCGVICHSRQLLHTLLNSSVMGCIFLCFMEVGPWKLKFTGKQLITEVQFVCLLFYLRILQEVVRSSWIIFTVNYCCMVLVTILGSYYWGQYFGLNHENRSRELFYISQDIFFTWYMW